MAVRTVLGKVKFTYDDFTQEELDSLKVKGDDGFSPKVDLEKTNEGLKISVTDAEGTKSETIEMSASGDKVSPTQPTDQKVNEFWLQPYE